MKTVFFIAALLSSGLVLCQSSDIYCSRYRQIPEKQHTINFRTLQDHRSDSVDILNTSIHLDISDLASGQISGYADLELKALQSGVATVRLDLLQLTVDSVLLNGSPVQYTHNDTHLVVELSSELPTSAQSLKVHYHGQPIADASWGGFYFQNGYAFNMGVGFAADPHSFGRVWFPCFDNFVERTSFDFYITTSSQHRASCNGELVGTTPIGADKVEYHWHLPQSIPSYLACVAVAPYSVVTYPHQGIAEEFPIELHAKAPDTASLKSAFVHLEDAIEAFENSYGAYSWGKVGYTLVPFNAGAMEHATNIAYPIYAASGLSQEGLMAHELGHMWWGDLVTCETAGDMWINEGWASFSAYRFFEWVYGREAYIEKVKDDLLSVLRFAHHLEGGFRPVAGQPHEYVYGDHVYKKGALVAHNLRGYLGDEDFFPAITAFLNANKFQPVSSEDLEAGLASVSGENMSPFFDGWVFGAGFPALVLDSFQVVPSGGQYEMKLFVHQKLYGASTLFTSMPFSFTAWDNSWQTFTGSFTMNGEYGEFATSVPFEPQLVSLNADQSLALATTTDEKTIKTTGPLSTKYSLMDVDVESINTDSALLRIEHYWVKPDPVKNPSLLPYALSPKRYWRVEGLHLEEVGLKAEFFYDGRTGLANAGYLDEELVELTEDSLVLLWRQSPGAEWEEYGHYSRNTLGGSDNKFGLMTLSKLLPGEYVLANIDHAVMHLQEKKSPDEVVVFPNPAHGTVVFRLPGVPSGTAILQVFDLAGKVVEKLEFGNREAQLGVGHLPNAQYIYEISWDGRYTKGTFVVN